MIDTDIQYSGRKSKIHHFSQHSGLVALKTPGCESMPASESGEHDTKTGEPWGSEQVRQGNWYPVHPSIQQNQKLGEGWRLERREIKAFKSVFFYVYVVPKTTTHPTRNEDVMGGRTLGSIGGAHPLCTSLLLPSFLPATRVEPGGNSEGGHLLLGATPALFWRAADTNPQLKWQSRR